MDSDGARSCHARRLPRGGSFGLLGGYQLPGRCSGGAKGSHADAARICSAGFQRDAARNLGPENARGAFFADGGPRADLVREAACKPAGFCKRAAKRRGARMPASIAPGDRKILFIAVAVLVVITAAIAIVGGPQQASQ